MHDPFYYYYYYSIIQLSRSPTGREYIISFFCKGTSHKILCSWKSRLEYMEHGTSTLYTQGYFESPPSLHSCLLYLFPTSSFQQTSAHANRSLSDGNRTSRTYKTKGRQYEQAACHISQSRYGIAAPGIHSVSPSRSPARIFLEGFGLVALWLAYRRLEVRSGYTHLKVIVQQK